MSAPRENVLSAGDLILSRQERNEILKLLDDVDSLVRYCSSSMPDVNRYYRGANAMWAVAWKIAGDHDKAAECQREIDKRS